MMVYILFDEPLYFQLNGNRQQSPRPQALRLLESHARHVLSAFLDYEVKLISAPEAQPIQKERMIAACFPANYVIQAERVGHNQFMVIGSDKLKVNAVYDALLPLKVEQLVPYGVGLRAYLNNAGLLSPEKITVCIDYLNAYVVISIFEGNRFNSPRRLVIKDEAHLVSELKRSLQAYLSEVPDARSKPMSISTNQMNWLEALTAQFPQANIKSFDSLCPCIDGLVLAKFNMHFRSLEDILRQRRQQVFVNRLKVGALSFFFVLLGLSTYGLAWGYNQHQTKEFHQALAYMEDLQSKLKQMHAQKIAALLYKGGVIDFASLYYEFYRRVPFGYRVKDWQIISTVQGQWVFKGAVYPASVMVMANTFRLTGLFQQAKLEAAMVEKVLGQVITLDITGEVGK